MVGLVVVCGRSRVVVCGRMWLASCGRVWVCVERSGHICGDGVPGARARAGAGPLESCAVCVCCVATSSRDESHISYYN